MRMIRFILAFSIAILILENPILCLAEETTQNESYYDDEVMFEKIVTKISLNKTYPSWIVNKFLDLLETKTHTDKELRFKKILEQFVGVEFLKNGEQPLDFIKQTWISSEKQQRSFPIRLELFLVCLDQGLLNLEIDRDILQHFFITHYLDTCLDRLQRYIKQDDFKSGVLNSFTTPYKLVAPNYRSEGLFDTTMDLRIKASKILEGTYWFLDIPIEFFKPGYDDIIQDKKTRSKMIDGIFPSLLRWMEKFNGMNPPVFKDFGQQAQQVGIPMYKLIGPHGIFKNYSSFIEELNRYALSQGVVIQEDKKVQNDTKDSKELEKFIGKWSELFSKIQSHPTTKSKTLKKKLLQASLEWIQQFNDNQFVSGIGAIAVHSFGISGRNIVGEDKIFASMYEYQRDLIEYAKSVRKRFKVNQALSLIIRKELSIQDYVVEMIYQWIKSHKRLPEFRDFGLDTFRYQVGCSFYSLSSVFGTFSYDYVLKLVWERALKNKKAKRVLELFPKELDSMVKMDLVMSRSNKYSPVKISRMNPRNRLKPIIPVGIKNDKDKVFLYVVEKYIYPWVKVHKRYPVREDFNILGKDGAIPFSRNFLFESKGLVPGYSAFIYRVSEECQRLASMEGVDISSFFETNMEDKDEKKVDIIPEEVLKDKEKLFSYIVVKLIYPRYKKTLKLPTQRDFHVNGGWIPLNYTDLFGSSNSVFGSFKDFSDRAVHLCNLLKEQEYLGCMDMMSKTNNG